MNKQKAELIRKLYSKGKSVQEIRDAEGVSQAVIYSVIRNQSWYDPNYEPPRRPRDILEDVGLVEINAMRNEGRSWDRISDTIRRETGSFVKGERIRDWFHNKDDVSRLARRYARRQQK